MEVQALQKNPIFNYFDMLSMAQKSYGKLLAPLCREEALTRNELDVLLFLPNNPGYARAADIVAHRGMTKSHVSLSVANLEQRQLLRRNFDPMDRRTAHLELTEAGKTIALRARKLQEQYFDALYRGVSEEEFAAWKRFTATVYENIRQLDGVLSAEENPNKR